METMTGWEKKDCCRGFEEGLGIGVKVLRRQITRKFRELNVEQEKRLAALPAPQL